MGKKCFLNLQHNVCIHQYLDQLIVFFTQRFTFQAESPGRKIFSYHNKVWSFLRNFYYVDKSVGEL